MNEDSKSWPIIVGIAVGVLGGVIAGLYVYSVRTEEDPDTKLRDATEIIAQCNQKIKEIEAGLQALRQPLVA